MEHATMTVAMWAAGLGFVAAVALPAGAFASFFLSPSRVMIGGMAAFGAGALFCALALELVAPHVEALERARHVVAASHDAGQVAAGGHGGDPVTNLLTLIAGGILGGLIFILADQLLNAKGGFLRKYATSMAYLSRQKNKRNEEVLRVLGQVELLRAVPPNAVQDLVDSVKERAYQAGDMIFDQGDEGDFMVFVKSGEVDLKHNGEHLKTLGVSSVIGEIALLTGSPRTASATVTIPTEVLTLSKVDFDRLRSLSPELDVACRDLAAERLGEIKARHVESATRVREWSERAIDALARGASAPTKLDIKKAHDEFHGSPMAIWLGNVIDGVPEAFVIGTGVLSLVLTKQSQPGGVGFWDIIPMTLVGGMFISNFPEALSAALTMRDQGFSKQKIIGLWSALAIVCSLSAAAGVLIGSSLDPAIATGIEGIAGGAMLTMVASTMLPEAAHEGGPTVTGFATLLGFFAATAFKLLE
ncbi:MAG: hypothetical protein RIQ81_1419 [Pseudomonadota bacterium]|jgi:CRP-like cAMP-binding protein